MIRGYAPALAATVLWIYMFYVTRPGEAEFKEQVLARGNLQPWLGSVGTALITTDPFSKLPGKVQSNRIDDYGLFTVMWSGINLKSNDVFLLGVLTRFIPLDKRAARQLLDWNYESDILVAIALHVISYILHTVNKRWAYRIFHLNWKRPYSIFLSTFNTMSLWTLIFSVTFLSSIGIDVRSSFPESKYSSLAFWTIYSVMPSLAVLATRFSVDRMASTIGPIGGLMGLCAYGIFSAPHSRVDLLSVIKVGCFGMLVLESTFYISTNPLRSPISLLLDVFIIVAGALAIYRIQHPNEIFTINKIISLTVGSHYGF